MRQTLSAIIKGRSIELLRETKPSPLWASLLLFAVKSVVGLLITLLSGYYDVMQDAAELMRSGSEVTYGEIYALTEKYTTTGGTLLTIVLGICFAVIMVGFRWYCLRVARGETPEAKSVFDSFGKIGKIILLHIVMWFLIGVQFLLLIVPGVIAIIRYSQAVYIMCEHPEYGVLQCLRESGRMMRGYKREYFMLMLSFLGWALLGFVFSLYVPFPVLGLWLEIYWGLSDALFHIHLIRAGLSGEEHRDPGII